MRDNNQGRLVAGSLLFMPSSAASASRSLGASLLAILIAVLPLFAFSTPLSEEAIREAYFLGQRRDESTAAFLSKYIHELPPPSYGPHILSITTYTPFAQAVLDSSRHTTNYSAQQAQLDHRHVTEVVQILVAIRFTDSYGPALIDPNPRSGRNAQMIPRPSDFWRDFNVAVFSDDKSLEPTSYDGHPDYYCNEGGCYLIGATIQLEFSADSFPSQTVTVQVDPPDVDGVAADFDLGLLR